MVLVDDSKANVMTNLELWFDHIDVQYSYKLVIILESDPLESFRFFPFWACQSQILFQEIVRIYHTVGDVTLLVVKS